MNGSYNGNGDTTDTVINHIDPGPGMLRKDNSPIFSRSNIGNRGNMTIEHSKIYNTNIQRVDSKAF